MTSLPPPYQPSPSINRPEADILTQHSLPHSSASIAASPSSASLLRSTTAGISTVSSRADALLQASLTHGSAPRASVSSSASVTRSSALRADALLGASLTDGSRSSSSAVTATPPSYRRTLASVARAASGPSVSRAPHALNIRDRSQSTKSSSYANTDSTTSLRLGEKHSMMYQPDRTVENNIIAQPARLTAAESKERLHQLQAQIRFVNAQRAPRDTTGVFKKACSTDILFLLDTTYSMRPYIDAARDQIKSIVREIKTTFLDETEVRIAVVSYMDHNQGEKSIRFLDFVTNADEVSTFLDGLKTGWGGDFPEDVLGGIRCALNASWKLQTRCVLHIADAPAHGSVLHDGVSNWDHYYQHGSEPHGLTYTPLLQQMVQSRLNYVFFRVGHHTDRMMLKFSEIYAAAGADVMLLRDNKCYKDFRKAQEHASSPWRRLSKQATAELLFEEVPLGTSFTMLQNLVVRSVTRSTSLSATRVLSATSQRSTLRGSAAGMGFESSTTLKQQPAPIKRTEDELEPVSRFIPSNTALEEISPQWITPSWFKDLLALEGFCPDTGIHDASTLNEMMAADENVKLSFTQLTVRKRPKPFAEGAMRLAYYALTVNSTNKFVVKTFKAVEEDVMAQMIEDMRAQALCKAFALEFNSLLKEEHAIDFIVTTGWQIKARKSMPNNYLSLEPFIDGEYVKYNNNAGYVKEQDPDDSFNDAAQAFSHFTYERSFGIFMVTDLQGCGHIFTDPAVQTKDPNRFKLSRLNYGVAGFKFFFATHVCNAVCAKLALQSKKEMFIDGKWSFRESWPTVENTVFCSNKLCRKIIRMTSAETTPGFPGHHWCTTCYPQLQSTTRQVHCEEPGLDHLFDVSLFYYESQGQAPPAKCPAHLEKDTTGFTAAAAGSMLLSRFSALNQSSTTLGRAW